MRHKADTRLLGLARCIGHDRSGARAALRQRAIPKKATRTRPDGAKWRPRVVRTCCTVCGAGQVDARSVAAALVRAWLSI